MNNDPGVASKLDACHRLITEEGARSCYEEDLEKLMLKRSSGSLDVEAPPMPKRFEQSAPVMYANLH